MTLERDVGAAHDGLPHVIEAVNHVPVVVVWDGEVGLEAGICLHDGELDKLWVRWLIFTRVDQRGNTPDSAADASWTW